MTKNDFFNIKRIKIVLNTNVKNEREMLLTGNMFNFKDKKINTGHPYFSDRYVYDQNALNELSLNKYSQKVYIFFDKSKFQEFLRKSKVADDTEKINMYSKDGFIHSNIMIMLNALFPIVFPIESVPMAITGNINFTSAINNIATNLLYTIEHTHLKNKYTVTKVVWLNTLNSNPVYYKDFNEDLYIYLEKYKEAIKGKLKIIEDEIKKINNDLKKEGEKGEFVKDNFEKNEKLLNMFLRIYTLKKYMVEKSMGKNYTGKTLGDLQNKTVLFGKIVDDKILSTIDQYKEQIKKAYSNDFKFDEMKQLLQDNIYLFKSSQQPKEKLTTDEREKFGTETDAINFLFEKLQPQNNTRRITEISITRSIDELIQNNEDLNEEINAEKNIEMFNHFINSLNSVIQNIKDEISKNKNITTIIDDNKQQITKIIDDNRQKEAGKKNKTDYILNYITKITSILKLIVSLNEIKTYEKYREINETDFYNTYIRKEKYYDLISQKYSKLLIYIKSTNPDVDSALTSGILNIPEYLKLINEENGKGAYVGVDEINLRETDESKPSFQIELFTELVGGIVTNETQGSLDCPYENNYLGNTFEKLFYNINSSNQLIEENKFIDLTNAIKKIVINQDQDQDQDQDRDRDRDRDNYGLNRQGFENAYDNIQNYMVDSAYDNIQNYRDDRAYGIQKTQGKNTNNFKINLETISNNIDLQKIEHIKDITDPNNKIENQTDIEAQFKNENYGLKKILSEFDEHNEDPKKNKALKSRMNKIISDIKLNIKQNNDDLNEYKKKGAEIPQKIYLELYRDDLYKKISQDLLKKISENEENFVGGKPQENVIGGKSHNLTKHRRLRCKKRKTLRKNTK